MRCHVGVGRDMKRALALLLLLALPAAAVAQEEPPEQAVVFVPMATVYRTVLYGAGATYTDSHQAVERLGLQWTQQWRPHPEDYPGVIDVAKFQQASDICGKHWRAVGDACVCQDIGGDGLYVLNLNEPDRYGQGNYHTEEEMAWLLEDYSEVWLVASESWLWDSRGLTQAWLDQHARLIESASFALVDVYHYDLPDLNSASQGD